ncbi:MAG: ATP-dependent zinc metalloprotease FtsH, partial [bacterium]|nr:ATP-dependent zinc metalloprotease FtsH [bacterium]
MDDKKKLRNLLLYLGIPVLIILAITILYSTQGKKLPTTYELVQYFQEGEVANYDINYGTGEIKLTLNDEKGTKVTGELADIRGFLQIIEPYTASADEAVTYNYIKASDNSFFLELIPTLILVGVLVVFWIFIMKKMGGGGLGGKEMNFGKAKIKNTNDEKRKTTFDDVAGADEEKEELQEIVEFLKAPDKFN